MLFFTPQWAHGESSHDAAAAYQRHIDSLAKKLPQPALDLHRTTSLHDARIQRVSYPRTGPMVVLLRCGDLQVGYRDVELTYHGLSLDESDLRCIHAILATPTEELLYDEFDLAGALVVHRLLFTSLGQVTLVFRDFTYRSTAVRSRDFDRGVDDLSGLPAGHRDVPADTQPGSNLRD